jgi:Spy/CpxP family protein refolding chaperone
LRGDPQPKVPDMKRSTPAETNAAPVIRTQLPRKPWRAAVLAVAIALGATATIFAVSPSARAFVGTSGMHHQDAVFAAIHGGRSPEQMHAHFDQVLTDAGADDAQKQQIHTIMKDAMEPEHADMQRFHDSCRRLTELLTADPIDDAAIQSVRAEQDQLLLATSHRLSDTMVSVAKVLSPAQRAKLGAQIDRMMAGHGMHHHGG